MSNLLLELFSQDLPHADQVKAEHSYRSIFSNYLLEKNMKYKKLEVFSTPCRIVIFIDSLDEEVKIEEKVIKGPKTDATDDAVRGFCEKNGVVDSTFLFKTIIGKNTYWIHRIREHYKKIEDILCLDLPLLIQKHDWQECLYSSDQKNLKWSRILKNILCIFDGKVLNFSYNGLCSNNLVRGHRFLSSDFAVKISSRDEYNEFLSNNYVLLSRSERKNSIINQAKDLVQDKDFTIDLEENLLNFIVSCFEYPKLAIGNLDEKYLQLPAKLIKTVLKDHQRCFISFKDNKLGNNFFYVSNNDNKNQQFVKRGYECAISARLNDAVFLWNNDFKLSLEERIILLKKIVFHKKLGSIFDKIQRLVKFIKKLEVLYNESEYHIIFSSIDFKALLGAAKYSKCDLTSSLVDEFPSLKGEIGYYIALNENISSDILDYIRYQYLTSTKNFDSKYLYFALLDNIDDLVGLFIAGERVDGNYDRYGMRKLALNIINLLRNIDISIGLKLSVLIYESVSLYSHSVTEKISCSEKILHFTHQILDFIKIRHTYTLKEKYSILITDAVFNSILLDDRISNLGKGLIRYGYDIKFVDVHVDNIFSLISEEKSLFSTLVSSYKRLNNIITGSEVSFQDELNSAFELENLSHELEEKLFNSLKIFRDKYPFSWQSNSLVNEDKKNFPLMCRDLLKVLYDVNALLDMLRINDLSNDKVNDRKNLVNMVLTEMKKIADFSKLYNVIDSLD